MLPVPSVAAVAAAISLTAPARHAAPMPDMPVVAGAVTLGVASAREYPSLRRVPCLTVDLSAFYDNIELLAPPKLPTAQDIAVFAVIEGHTPAFAAGIRNGSSLEALSRHLRRVPLIRQPEAAGAAVYDVFIDSDAERGNDLIVGVVMSNPGEAGRTLVLAGKNSYVTTVTLPRRVYGEFHLDAAQSTGEVIRETHDPNNPGAVIQDKRDVWRFTLNASVPTLTARRSSSANNYLKFDSTLSQYACDPKSQVELRYGVERGIRRWRLNADDLAVSETPGDWRIYGEGRIMGDQTLDKRSFVTEFGIGGLVAKPHLSGALKPDSAALSLSLQKAWDLRNTGASAKPRGFAELKWGTWLRFAPGVFPATKCRFELLGRAWHFWDDRTQTDAASGAVTSLGRWEKYAELDLYLPVASKASKDSQTYIRIGRITGANEAQNFQRSASWVFGAGVKF
ncbi:MAG TPA: hypothetical protein VGM37_20010 [Armatimonadota bacterium]